jgi:hypothetical protein
MINFEMLYILFDKLNGSLSWTSSAAALIRESFNAAAKACSSTRPPRAVFIRNAPSINKTKHCVKIYFVCNQIVSIVKYVFVSKIEKAS